ncbi:hypothetical protein [Methyloraptor flagellatus]|uniref:Head-tail adaptor protein n=1 Tax=Methyloraptor flagellatus TaxID=3162530 RepID=A0AAU7X7Q7_9HYPH
MSKISFIDTQTTLELGPNETKTWHWNNAAPANAVWSAAAIPFATGDSTKGFTQDTRLEVTDVWHRLLVTEHKPFPQSQTVETKVETEIYYTIRNLSPSDHAKFKVVLSAVSA